MPVNDLERARHNMVVQQIRPWEVIDERVLEAVQAVPRERFVPPAYLGLAFADIEVPLGHGEKMMSPKLEARMMQALAIRPDDAVLEVGTGSGFVTACLARLGRQVTSLEIHPELSTAAGERLASLNIGTQVEADWVGLTNIAYDPKDEVLDVATDHLDHRIERPREVWVREGDDGLEAIEVVRPDGTQEIVRLAKPMLLPSPAGA